MAQLIIDPKKSINFDMQEIIRFFGSEIKDWADKNKNFQNVKKLE
jgi:hypothetical protein